jgi:hypothetical protein
MYEELLYAFFHASLSQRTSNTSIQQPSVPFIPVLHLNFSALLTINTSVKMRLLATILTLMGLAIAAPSPIASPTATCTGTYCAVYPEPWSGVRKTNSIVTFCAGACVNGACV